MAFCSLQLKQQLSNLIDENGMIREEDAKEVLRENGLSENNIEELFNNIKEIEDGLIKLSDEYEKVSKRLSEVLEIKSKINDLTFKKYKSETSINEFIKYIKMINSEIENISNKLNKKIGRAHV